MWTIKPEEDPETGDLILTLPPELLEQVGWKCGDVLVWKEGKSGTFILSKKPEPPITFASIV